MRRPRKLQKNKGIQLPQKAKREPSKHLLEKHYFLQLQIKVQLALTEITDNLKKDEASAPWSLAQTEMGNPNSAACFLRGHVVWLDPHRNTVHQGKNKRRQEYLEWNLIHV